MKNFLTLTLLLIGSITLTAQQNVGIGTTTPDPSAALDINANDKGILIPRMNSAQRTAITPAATGLLVFDTTTDSFWYYNGTVWSEIGRSYSAGAGITIAGKTIINTGDTDPADDITTSSMAGGDLTGTFSTLQIAADAVGSAEIENGTIEAVDMAPGVIPTSLPISGAAAGDLTGTYPGPEIADGAVDNAALANGSVSREKITSGSATLGQVLTADGAGGSVWIPSNTLQDSDGDTKIQVEKTTNENVIHFDLGGTESMTLRKNAAGTPKLELLNTAGNIFIGAYTGDYNTIGEQNTSIGHSSLPVNTTGSGNNALGYKTLDYNTEGNNNTAIGTGAESSNVAGNNNTATGVYALSYNEFGNDNAAFGFEAGQTINGRDNTLSLGSGSGGIVSASNRVEIGNTSISWIGGEVGWSTYSDARIKNQVKENVPGLAFITRLRPVTYHLDIHKQNELCFKGKKTEHDWKEKYAIEQKQMTGFIAQEVEKAAQNSGYDFSGVEKGADETGMYSVRYSEFVVPLVKAVQEQQVQIEAQKALLEKQQAENAALSAQMQKITAAMKKAGIVIE